MIVGTILSDEQGEPVFPIFLDGRFDFYNDDDEMIQPIAKISFFRWYAWALRNGEYKDFKKSISSCSSFKQVQKKLVSDCDKEAFEVLMNQYYESEEWN